MNDFTKEDLSLIFISVPFGEATKELKNKLQSMIDNYCEHDYEEFSDSDGNKGIQCWVCKKVEWQ